MHLCSTDDCSIPLTLVWPVASEATVDTMWHVHHSGIIDKGAHRCDGLSHATAGSLKPRLLSRLARPARVVERDTLCWVPCCEICCNIATYRYFCRKNVLNDGNDSDDSLQKWFSAHEVLRLSSTSLHTPNLGSCTDSRPRLAA